MGDWRYRSRRAGKVNTEKSCHPWGRQEGKAVGAGGTRRSPVLQAGAASGPAGLPACF